MARITILYPESRKRALKNLASEDDRSLSSYLSAVLKEHVKEAMPKRRKKKSTKKKKRT